MYIEFPIPHDTHTGAGWYIRNLFTALERWQQQHSIQVKYRIHYLNFRVWFDRPEHYSAFYLTWRAPDCDIDEVWFQYQIREADHD